MENVIRVRANEDFSLDLWFDGGDHKRFDARPYLTRGEFVRLQNVALFQQAYVAYDTVCWPGGLDISPATLFDRSVPAEQAAGS